MTVRPIPQNKHKRREREREGEKDSDRPRETQGAPAIIKVWQYSPGKTRDAYDLDPSPAHTAVLSAAKALLVIKLESRCKMVEQPSSFGDLRGVAVVNLFLRVKNRAPAAIQVDQSPSISYKISC